MFEKWYNGGRKDPRETPISGGMTNRMRVDMNDLTCQWLGCETGFPSLIGRGRPPKWCDVHRLAMTRIRREAARDKAGTKCSESDCERPVRALTVCNMHYKRILQAQGRLAGSPWDERRRNNSHVRRARKAGTQANGAVRVSELIARDGLACGICSEVIDLALTYPHPQSRSIDHILPIARGGAHSPENCQLAHLRCNVSKGDRIV